MDCSTDGLFDLLLTEEAPMLELLPLFCPVLVGDNTTQTLVNLLVFAPLLRRHHPSHQSSPPVHGRNLQQQQKNREGSQKKNREGLIRRNQKNLAGNNYYANTREHTAGGAYTYACHKNAHCNTQLKKQRGT
jgi:hypothetical protein